jgi:FtsP/CotA-like multicopper oxidase with cupredoxin domain
MKRASVLSAFVYVFVCAFGAVAAAAVLPQEAPMASGKTRTYFIAADEVLWDYAPAGRNRISGEPFDDVAKIWVERGPDRIGPVYKKALYREYTDETFRTLKPPGPAWEHLGILGPVIRAEVGDTIRVVFKNNGRHPFTVHPHGVLYQKDSEGAKYDDGTPGASKRDDGVPPGGTHVYVWQVPERAGPGPGEPSTSLWMYHSHAHESRDVNAGLIGPLIITRRGMANAEAVPTDIDREFVVAFAEIDENLSWYIDENIQTFTGKPETVKKPAGPSFIDPFGNSNLMETMNGFIFGNGSMMTMREGERVRWYLMSSTNFEVHAPHWHGNVVTAQHMRTDVVNLGTMGMIVADMVADNPGTWLFHCHVEPHLSAGMVTRFKVEAARPPATQGASGGPSPRH